jgi:protein-S-isoprenylcysteine O-methyltransferase Ste14
MKKRIRIQGMLIVVTLLLLVASAGFLFPHWQSRLADDVFDTLGLLCVLFGFLVRIISRGYKEESCRNGNALVTGGPYLFMSNPMYFGTLLIGIGIVSMLLRWWTLPVFLGVYLTIYVPQIRKEEKVLSERFGESYTRFRMTRPRILPDIRRARAIGETISSLKIAWVKKEFASCSVTLFVILLIEAFQDKRLFGTQAFVKECIEFAFVAALFIAAVSVVIVVHRKPWITKR